MIVKVKQLKYDGIKIIVNVLRKYGTNIKKSGTAEGQFKTILQFCMLNTWKCHISVSNVITTIFLPQRSITNYLENILHIFSCEYVLSVPNETVSDPC